VTAVASVATPTVVPIVVPTALMHQNTAIATAAAAFASSMRGDNRLFIIPLTLPFSPTSALFQTGDMRDLRVDSASTNNISDGLQSLCSSPRIEASGKIEGSSPRQLQAHRRRESP
jgi:hypothetical protein